ncbi:hypothetical protein BUALT_Bualt07G0069600 [Buddleja alternifolia]|uniref:AIPP2-like SPOC-like domain-containing protein n=1 Tax=Buddleja alternifolia TaxID=168488 RepID=A0AAV6XJF0_9LAMI|nr:hypothetical protein BUALT_Bualt07G0069600 [Buddleja alternifolia]
MLTFPFYVIASALKLKCEEKEECCDICGDVGVADAIITCSQCKINCEHIYCMRTPLEGDPDDWRCEICESTSKPKPLPSSSLTGGASKLTNPVEVSKGTVLPAERKKLLHGSKKSSIHWEKKVETGKTKYISVKDAIKLSSGEKNSVAPLKIGCHQKSPQPKSRLNIAGRTPMRTTTVPMNFSSQRLGNMDISKGQPHQSKQLTKAQRSLSSLQPSEAPVNKHVQKGHPTEVKLPQTKAKSLIKAPPSSYAPPVTISGKRPYFIKGGNKCTTTELETCNATNVNNNFLPDFSASWMGCFSIQDDLIHGKLNYQIQALPPSQVRKKVYEFSKKMPKILHFQLVPVKKLWINLFRDYFPDRRDIGLYFVPSDRVRCEDYFNLLESISKKNMALRKQIDDVELLVFTSKLLPVDCQCLGGKYFLWGLFHRVRRDLDTMGLKLSVQSSEDANCEEVDMDIDMIGGVDVGRTDVPVQRELLREKQHVKPENSPTSKADNLGFKKRY